MQTRREVLSHSAKVAVMLAAAGMLPSLARAQATGYNSVAFDAKTIPELMKALGGGAPVESKDVTVTGPDIAENGAERTVSWTVQAFVGVGVWAGTTSVGGGIWLCYCHGLHWVPCRNENPFFHLLLTDPVGFHSTTLLCGGSGCCGYNQLQRLDEQTKSAWSEGLHQYPRRAGSVPLTSPLPPRQKRVLSKTPLKR